jgi:hypothetical protein
MNKVDGAQVAWFAQRFALLADRPELTCSRAEERIRASDGSLRELVAAAVATDADLACAQAVRILRRSRRKQRPIIELIEVLSPERMLGVLYALVPARRAEVVRSSAVVAYYERQVRDRMLKLLAAASVIERSKGDLFAELDACLSPAEREASDSRIREAVIRALRRVELEAVR